jgi:hypothetical protein
MKSTKRDTYAMHIVHSQTYEEKPSWEYHDTNDKKINNT